jgi:integrase
MARVASTKLTTNRSGGWTARKRIPADAQDDYERLFGVRWEERFNSGAVPVTLAKAKHREWLNTVETRIENIRAERRGAGRTLTPMEARALSGEWYHWFCARHLPNAKAWGADYWQHRRGELGDDVRDAMEAFWKASGKPWHPDVELMAIYEEDPAAKARGLAIVADHAESSQFLHAKGMVLEPASREMFLDCLLHDYFAAIRLLIRRANDDYGADTWPERFPMFERTPDPGLTPWMLFERWVAERKPTVSAVDRWRCAFLKLQEDFPDHSAAALTPEQAQRWADGLVNDQRGARTVRDVWVVSCRRVFEWALRKGLISRNPFKTVEITVARKPQHRETKAFTEQEIKAILSTALSISEPKTKRDAGRRWAPWLLAYTGARAGEITQLRGADVMPDGIPRIKITPEAGTVKTKQTRVVPLHEHLIEQGFLEFVRVSGKGPLFYREAVQQEDDPTNPRKRRYTKAREYLAGWIRDDLGINDPELQPTHAFRHSFKQIGHRSGISERLLDAIVGHAPRDVGRGYGAPTLSDMAEALKRFPRYGVTAGESSQADGDTNGCYPTGSACGRSAEEATGR